MFSNLYLKLGIIGVILAVIVGDVLYIRHLHHVIDGQKTTITTLNTNIETMKANQKDQTRVTTKTVEKLIKGPTEIREVIKTVKDTPLPEQCLTPDYAQNIKDSF